MALNVFTRDAKVVPSNEKLDSSPTNENDEMEVMRLHEIETVREILSDMIQMVPDKRSQRRNVQLRLPQSVLNLGLPKGLTALMGAMIASRPEIVSLLLEHGADPFQTDTFKMADIGKIVLISTFLNIY